MTKPVCKPLLPVYDKSLLYYPLAVLQQAGIREVLVIVPPDDTEPFVRLLGDGSQLGMNIQYIEQKVQRGISVTAVCSGPMDTEFLDKAFIRGRSKTFDILPYCDPVAVARGSYRAAKKGRAVHTPRAFFKLYRVIAKILPQRWMIQFTRT